MGALVLVASGIALKDWIREEYWLWRLFVPLDTVFLGHLTERLESADPDCELVAAPGSVDIMQEKQWRYRCPWAAALGTFVGLTAG